MRLDELDELGGVGLDTIDDQAGLQLRRDRKYLLDAAVASELLSWARPRARVLDIGGTRRFRYRSLYFDTPDFSTYRMAATRRPQRYKVRIRTYVDSETSMFEVKERRTDRLTVKHRWPHDPSSPERLAAADLHRMSTLEPLISMSVRTTLRPTLRTTFDRSTLLFDDTSSTSHPPARVTIDVGLHCTTPEGDSVELPDVAIVETKSHGAATTTDRFLWSVGQRPTRFSKYATTLAAIDHDLPANAWARVLHRHFDRPPSWARPRAS